MPKISFASIRFWVFPSMGYYILAMLDEPNYQSLFTTIIHQELKKRFLAILRSCTPIQLAQVLTTIGISRQHTRLGYVYLVKRVKDGE